MTQVYEGNLNASGLHFALVVSRFNALITDRLLAGAHDMLIRHGAQEKNIDIIKVPGAYEIPLGVKKALAKKKYDAVIAIGALIRGATSHFEYLSSAVSKELITLSTNSDTPVSFGIITAETLEQAIERAGAKAGNRGVEAALSAIEMASLSVVLSKKK